MFDFFTNFDFQLSWLFYTSFVILFGWVGVLLHKIGGIPVSLSETRYLVNESKTGHLLWYLMCSLTAIPLMIVWIIHHKAAGLGHDWLIYTCCLGLVGVGIAGDFKDAGWKFVIHCAFALFAAAGCIAWMWMFSPLAYMIIPVAIFFTMIGLYTGGRSAENRKGKPERNAIVFYLEFVCFLLIYIALFQFFAG